MFIYQLLVTRFKEGIMEESIMYTTDEFYFSTLKKAEEQKRKETDKNIIGLEIVQIELDNITENRFSNPE